MLGGGLPAEFIYQAYLTTGGKSPLFLGGKARMRALGQNAGLPREMLNAKILQFLVAELGKRQIRFNWAFMFA